MSGEAVRGTVRGRCDRVSGMANVTIFHNPN
jgi:hypothetical protein